jgi:hypothetical protein
MLHIDVSKWIECSKKHECALDNGHRCVYCDLSFNHIVEEPLLLSCTHSICKKCVPQEKTEAICKNDNRQGKIVSAATMVENLVESNKKKLALHLQYKYQQLIELCEGE